MMRAVVSRLVCLAIFVALAVAGAWVAIEALARVAGRSSALLGVDYRWRWADLASWDPSDAAQLGLWLAVIAGGVVLLVLALGRSRPAKTATLEASSLGDISLRSRSVAPVVQSRLAAEPWISQSRARTRVKGTRVEVTASPATSRPWDDDEVASARQGIAAEIARIGLDPGTVKITPRQPKERVR